MSAEKLIFLKNYSRIFPLANDTAGGQLGTEYNFLGSQRVMTGVDQERGSANRDWFAYGPSFTRTMSDFKVTASGAAIEVSPGWAIINGYFVSCEAPCVFDIADWNETAETKLTGSLTVGFKTYFSNQVSTQDSMMVDPQNEYYTGIQLVIMPSSQAVDPYSATDLSSVTMDLKLATFDYKRNTVTNLKQNESKIAFLDYRRIRNQSDSEGGDTPQSLYPDISGLANNKFYVLCIRKNDQDDTWTFWEDISSQLFDLSNGVVTRLDEGCKLIVPIYDAHGLDDPKSISIDFPDCDYEGAIPGMASKILIDAVKGAQEKLDELNTKLNKNISELLNNVVGYLPIAEIVKDVQDAESKALGHDDPLEEDKGKAILVGSDRSILTTETATAPTTIYVVVPQTIEDQTIYVWSNPIIISPEVPIATPETVGGVKNVDLENEPALYTDRGYVYVDSEGHLRLRDYALLRSGQLAYALTEDFSPSENLTAEEIQASLDDYVNNRIAMPGVNENNQPKYDIQITIPKINSSSNESPEYFIENVDSRFGASIHIHLEAVSDGAVIHIKNCEKAVVYISDNSQATVIVTNSNVFYTSSLLSNANVSFVGCRFWYDSTYKSWTGMDSQYVDVIDNQVLFTPSVAVSEADLIEQVNESTGIHLHTSYLPHHFSLDGEGRITEIGFVLSCNSTFESPSTAETSSKKLLVVQDFEFPAFPGFEIPLNRLVSTVRFSSNYGLVYRSIDELRSIESQFSAYYDPSNDKGVLTESVEATVYAVSDVIDDSTDHQGSIENSKVLVTGVADRA